MAKKKLPNKLRKLYTNFIKDSNFKLLCDVYICKKRPCKLFAPMVICEKDEMMVWLWYLDKRKEISVASINDIIYCNDVGKILFGDCSGS